MSKLEMFKRKRVEIKCPYCHRIMPDYEICNCVKIYNQALDDAIEFFMNHIHCNDNNPVIKNYVCGQLEKMKK